MDRGFTRKINLLKSALVLRTTCSPIFFGIFLTILIIANGFVGCAYFSSKSDGPNPNVPDRAKYEADEAKLLNWEKRLESKEYMAVNNEIYQFFSKNSQSQHWYGIMFAYGRSKEGIEDWSAAIKIYQQIIQRSTDRQMEFVALALYRMAFCHEVLMENEKALAALTDASRLHAYLPMEIIQAEIPARIASVHARLNQSILADRYTQKAEKGIMQIRAIKKNADPEWLSRTLVRMGSLALTHVDEESFLQNILTLSRNQRYLIQAIEINHSQWAPEAQKILLSTYSNLWGFIENYKEAPSSDWEADLVNEAKKKSDFISWYLEAIEKLKSFQAPEESPAFLRTAEVYFQVKQLEAKALALLDQELLKRPWNQSVEKRASASTRRPSLKSSDAADILDPLESEKPKHIPSGLPKKKTK